MISDLSSVVRDLLLPIGAAVALGCLLMQRTAHISIPTGQRPSGGHSGATQLLNRWLGVGAKWSGSLIARSHPVIRADLWRARLL